MPPDQRPDDEDTQEHVQAPEYPPRPHRPPAQDASTGAQGGPAAPAPTWSSQQQWQQPPDQQWQQPPDQQWQQPPDQQWQQPPDQQWQQPPEQQWQQPQHPQASQYQQWQQPPRQWAGGQQGWGPSGYWAPTAQYSSNPLVIVGGVILVVFGLLVTLVGLIGLLLGAIAESFLEEVVTPNVELQFDAGAVSAILLVVFGIVLLLGILHLLSGLGIFMHKGWARAIGVVLAVLGTLFGVLAVVTALEASRPQTGELVVPLVIAVGYGLTLFALIAGGNHFRRIYPG
jgi:hypothetical protein